MITKDDALHADTFHVNHEPAGRIECWRRNGATQTWKTRPEHFRIPVRYGLRTYAQIYHTDADRFHRADQCNTHHVSVRTDDGGDWYGIVIAELVPDNAGYGVTRVQVTTRGALRGYRVGDRVDVSTGRITYL